MVVHNFPAEGTRILSDAVVHKNYARHIPELQRRENWLETCARQRNMHIERYPQAKTLIEEAFRGIEEKKLLGSMRTAQFAGQAILDKENRGYNCAYLPIIDIEAFGELLYNLLCGTGVGYSVQQRHIKGLPKMQGFAPGTHKYVVEDTIEGWCEALMHLLNCCASGLPAPDFDLSLIRPKNAILITSGGRAPGPDPLRQMLDRVLKVLQDATAMGPCFLEDIQVHDICCHGADAVHAGGIRRAAMIAFFDRWSLKMLKCKSGDWWLPYDKGGNPQRGRANNSAVFVRGEVSHDDFKDFYRFVRENGTGEPGIYWTNDPDVLSNPCVEIGLYPFQFCNLSTVNGMTVKNAQDFYWRVRMAARVGTLQAGYTNFRFMRKQWQEQTELEALIGVSITGIGCGKVEKYDLRKAAAIAIDENVRVARLIGINPAARTTCVKPEGNGSAVLGTPSGIHSWKAAYYFRSMRIGKDEACYQYLKAMVPELVEDDLEKPDIQAIFRVPIKAGEGYIESDETALDLLERVRHFNKNWVHAGHVSGANTHNVSATVTVRQHEWDDVERWKWENREDYNGLTAFPYWDPSMLTDAAYKQLPFSPCTKEDYEAGLQQLNNINFDDVVELEDNTNLTGAVACAGGVCDIL